MLKHRVHLSVKYPKHLLYHFLIIYLDPSPRDIRVVRVNDTTIQVFWSPIYYPPVERYIIYYNDKSENIPENRWPLYSPFNSSATTAIINGLKPAAMYDIRVSAYFLYANISDPSYTSETIKREGDLSEIHIADIYRRNLDPSPRDVRVVRVNDTTIQVFWSPIYYPPVERYIIYYNDKSENKPENQWPIYSPVKRNTTTAIISGLKPTAMYNVRVSAEFSYANINDPSHISGTMRWEGDLSEIHIADIYRRKLNIAFSIFNSRNDVFRTKLYI